MRALYEQIATELSTIEGVKIIDLHNSKTQTVGEQPLLPMITLELDLEHTIDEAIRQDNIEARVTIRIYQENFANTDIKSPQKDRGLRIFELVDLVKATLQAMNFRGEKLLLRERLNPNQTNVYLNELEYAFNYTERIC